MVCLTSQYHASASLENAMFLVFYVHCMKFVEMCICFEHLLECIVMVRSPPWFLDSFYVLGFSYGSTSAIE
jgi:hypothetical protein